MLPLISNCENSLILSLLSAGSGSDTAILVETEENKEDLVAWWCFFERQG